MIRDNGRVGPRGKVAGPAGNTGRVGGKKLQQGLTEWAEIVAMVMNIQPGINTVLSIECDVMMGGNNFTMTHFEHCILLEQL